LAIRQGESPTSPVPPRALAATKGETDEPDDSEDNRNDPQRVDREAQASEEQCQQQYDKYQSHVDLLSSKAYPIRRLNQPRSETRAPDCDGGAVHAGESAAERRGDVDWWHDATS
jgi:hypothetical protein